MAIFHCYVSSPEGNEMTQGLFFWMWQQQTLVNITMGSSSQGVNSAADPCLTDKKLFCSKAKVIVQTRTIGF